jgi:hypothetical protein
MNAKELNLERETGAGRSRNLLRLPRDHRLWSEGFTTASPALL